MAQQQTKALPVPVDWDELYPGRFLKATEFKGKQVTLRIAKVRIEELVGDKGPQIKGVISFERTDKEWAINRTNGICVKAMFGSKVQEWVGKRVTLYPAMHDGEPAIRVWGSPDIERDFEVVVALPRKRPFAMVMHKTGAKPAAAQNAQARPGRVQQPAPAPQPEPEREREPGADDEQAEGLPADSDTGELTLAEDAPYDAAASRALDLSLVEDGN